MTVGELMTRMSGAEFDEWKLFYRLHPFGEWRDDYRAALIAQTVFNMNRSEKVDPRSLADFMPRFDIPPKSNTPNQDAIRQKFLTWMPPKKANPSP